MSEGHFPAATAYRYDCSRGSLEAQMLAVAPAKSLGGSLMVDQYFPAMSRELQRKSDRIREAFKTHRPSAGDNREALVADFIGGHLPKAFGVGTGLVTSRNQIVSRQADIVVFDQLLNTPLHPELPEKVWLCEPVYALMEVKTSLTPSELNDSIEKCRRFKTLERRFLDGPLKPRITDSLFVIWAFHAANSTTVASNIAQAIREVPFSERPDFIVVPGSVAATSGSYFALAKTGQPTSDYRRQIEGNQAHVIHTLAKGFEVLNLGEHSLMAFFIWFIS